MKQFSIYFFISILATSCNSFNNNFLAKKTAKDSYQDVLKKKDPVLLTAWDSAGKFALDNPHKLTDSYAEYGATNGGTADANAYSISLKPGQRIIASYSVDSLSMPAFLEIWQQNTDGHSLLASADSITKSASYFSEEGGDYLLKFQPKMEVKAFFKLTIQLAPGLDFPIDPNVKSNIGSVWGDPRDAGVRKHEGIDIFAARGSKILAEADGIIAYVDETEIGGKVVSLRPKDQNFNIYHAHLDEQLVQSGQKILKGQVLGTVGNTGNAKTTAPHLHLGIYTRNGAIDPINFVKKITKLPTIISKKLKEQLRFSTTAALYPGPSAKNPFNVKKGFVAVTEGFSNGFYRVRLEDGNKGYVKESDYKKVK